MITISVAMCTFNGEKYIQAQIDSILSQSRRVDEIVVGDDGSSDRTMEILSEYAVSAPAVAFKILGSSGSPLGVTKNFERALSHCGGDVIILADQDDVWEPDRVEAAVRMLAEDPSCLLCVSDAVLIDERDRVTGTLFKRMGVSARELDTIQSDSPMVSVVRRSFLPGMAMAMRRTLIDQALPIPQEWPHDYWLLAIAALNHGVSVAPVPLVQYRQHASNVLGVGDIAFRTRLLRLITKREKVGSLASLFVSLDERARTLPGVRPNDLRIVEGKRNFEIARTTLGVGAVRVMRICTLLFSRDGYSSYASNGAWNSLRDLMQGFRPLDDGRE